MILSSSVCKCICVIVLIVLNGLLSSSRFGLLNSLCVIVVCCVMLFDSVVGSCCVMLVRLILLSNCVMFGLCLFCVLDVKLMLFVIDSYGSSCGF